MARKKIFVNQLDLSNTQSPGATIMAIDTNMEGIIIGNPGISGAGEINVQSEQGMLLRNGTAGNILISQLGTGDITLDSNTDIDIQADDGVNILNSSNGDILLRNDASVTPGNIIIDSNSLGGKVRIQQSASGGVNSYIELNHAGTRMDVRQADNGAYFDFTAGSGWFIDTSNGGGAFWEVGGSAGIVIQDSGSSSGGFQVDMTNVGNSPVQIQSHGVIELLGHSTASINIKNDGTSGSVNLKNYTSDTGSLLVIDNQNGTTNSAVVVVAQAGGVTIQSQTQMSLYSSAGDLDIDATTGIDIANATSGNIRIYNAGSSGEIQLVDSVGQQIILNDQSDGNRMVLEADGPGLRIDVSGAGLIVDSTGGGTTWNIGGSPGFLIQDGGTASGGINVNLTGGGGNIYLYNSNGSGVYSSLQIQSGVGSNTVQLWSYDGPNNIYSYIMLPNTDSSPIYLYNYSAISNAYSYMNLPNSVGNPVELYNNDSGNNVYGYMQIHNNGNGILFYTYNSNAAPNQWTSRLDLKADGSYLELSTQDQGVANEVSRLKLASNYSSYGFGVELETNAGDIKIIQNTSGTSEDIYITNNSGGGKIRLEETTSGGNNYYEINHSGARQDMRNNSGGLWIDTSGGTGAQWETGTSGGLQIKDATGSGGGFLIDYVNGGSGIILKANGGGGGFQIENNIAGSGASLNVTSGNGINITNNIGGTFIISNTPDTQFDIIQNAATAIFQIQSNSSGEFRVQNANVSGLMRLSSINGGGMQLDSVGGIQIVNITSGKIEITNSYNYGADSIDVSTQGGIDIDAETGITINNNTSGNIVITNAVSAGQIQLIANVGASEIDLTAATIDINGNADVSGTLTMGEIEIPTISGADPVDSPNAGTARYRTDTDVLWIYNGSAWKSVALA